jgi:NADH-quinone oxidoreductase subunit M
MIPVLLITLPIFSGLMAFFMKGQSVKSWALLSSFAVLGISIWSLFSDANLLSYSQAWLPSIGSRFDLTMQDGLSKLMCLLTALSFPLVLISTQQNSSNQSPQFFALMLLTQAGLMGVFLAADALLFYFFWELALIPVYFLCSIWGGEKRIAVTFKFFIYTFVGSILMLVGILSLYYMQDTPSFAWSSLTANASKGIYPNWAFWLFFLAFAIKMPIFPLHTWQPDAYEQSPTPVTMILSGVMVKMGLFAAIRWLLPLFPQATEQFAWVIVCCSVIGMIYASLLAIRQDDIKRLIAYSSIAHIGLMSAVIFSGNASGMGGVMIQMFHHGVNVIGLWIVANAIEQKLGTRSLSEMGGLAQKAPTLSILLVVMSLANVALPLTNAFVGEFLMFNSLFKYNVWLTAVAGISIILAAVYTLNMVQKVIYGEVNSLTEKATDTPFNVNFSLVLIAILIVVMGVYPQPLLDLTKDAVTQLFAQQ